MMTSTMLTRVLSPAFPILFATLASAQPYFEDLRFTPKDLPADQSYGQLVSIHDGLFTVGASYYDNEGAEYGVAYAHKLSNPQDGFEISPGEGGSILNFGPRTVIQDGKIAASVSTYTNGTRTRSVKVYDATDGSLLYTLSPADSSNVHAFGRSLSMKDGILAVGSYYDDDNGDYSGSVYLFDAESGTFLRKLLAEDGMPSDYFGLSVSIHNGQVAVGASGHDANGPSSGAVYLFDLNTGQQLHKFLAEDGHINHKLGTNIALGEGVVAVGADRDYENGSYAGAMYLFDTTTGDQIAKVFPDTPEEYEYFGASLSISNGFIAVGAENEDKDEVLRVGSVYLFDLQTGEQLAKLLPSDTTRNRYFGDSVSLDGSDLIVGSFGAVYIYNIQSLVCPADLTGEGDLNFLDVSAFLTAFGNQDSIADFEEDGSFNFLDVSAYLASFGKGCP